MEQGELDIAIADYSEVIRLDPRPRWAFSSRGMVHQSKGNLAAAMRDFSQAIEINPRNSYAHICKASVLMHQRDRASIAGFQRAIDVVGYRYDGATFAVIQGHLAARILGDDMRAVHFLSEARGKLSSEWPYPVVRYLNGEISASALRASADDNGQETEVRCYLALDQLARGNVDAARTDLQWVVDHGERLNYVEYGIAACELRRLDDRGNAIPSTSTVTQAD